MTYRIILSLIAITGCTATTPSGDGSAELDDTGAASASDTGHGDTGGSEGCTDPNGEDLWLGTNAGTPDGQLVGDGFLEHAQLNGEGTICEWSCDYYTASISEWRAGSGTECLSAREGSSGDVEVNGMGPYPIDFSGITAPTEDFALCLIDMEGGNTFGRTDTCTLLVSGEPPITFEIQP